MQPVTTSATRPDLAGDLLPPAAPMTIVIAPDATAQRIDGFGGCFNEIGWRALLRLDDVDRGRVLKSLFDPHDGLGFNICRVPIGSSDFALSPYSLDDEPGDVDLKHFSIDRDRFMLIPYIKAAMAIRPDLRLWASPWSPPAWMKTSGAYHGGQLRQEPEILKAYATYLARFVEDYRAEGIDVFAVDVQNEPIVDTKYPSCPWPNPATMRDFIRDYAGPTFAQRQVPAKIWLGAIANRDFDWFKPILDNPTAMQAIGGVGIQYASRDVAARLHATYPNLTLMQTETMCFSGHNDWFDAEETFRQMLIFFRGGVSAYMYWNMVLDQTGLSSWAWSQDSTIVVDAYDGSIIYTPQFVLMKHLTTFVKPGAVFLKPMSEADPALAFKTEDGATVVVIMNSNRYDRMAELHVGNQRVKVNLPAKSFSTFVCR
ncbi:MAG: glycoside hydrolase family 30 beta sandwich domain-containing protein [Tepidisphaeraceae bacterium]